MAVTTMMDLVIEGTRLLAPDGSWREERIWVQGDRIAEIGPGPYLARRTVTAPGLLAVPGFVDIHNHSDLCIQRARQGGPQGCFDPLLRLNHNYLRQGVTTVVTGNCGEGITELDEWKAVFENGFGTNVCHLIPYGALRREVMGDARAPTRRDVERLCARLAQELTKGAIGLSTAFDSSPGRWATTEDLIECCKVVAEFGGVYVTHVRRESASGIVASVREAIRIGEESGVAVHLSQLRVYRPTCELTPDHVLAPIRDARARGLRITASQNPYTTISGELDDRLLEHLCSNLLPDVSPSPVTAADVRPTLAIVVELIGAERIIIANSPATRRHEGLTLAAAAALDGVAVDELLQALFRVSPPPYVVIDILCEEMLEAFMREDFVYTSSNGEVALPGDVRLHPRSYGAFPRKLREYALERGIIPFEQALMSMTVGPAQVLGLSRRGALASGYHADIVLLDPAEIGDQHDYVRPNRYARGVRHVIVNGRVALEDGSGAQGRLLIHEKS